MPLSEPHKNKWNKNYVTLALIVTSISMMGMVTTARVANAGDILGLPNKFEEQQNSHLKDMEEQKEKFFERGAEHLAKIDNAKEGFFERGADHLSEIDKAKDDFFDQGEIHLKYIDESKLRFFEQGAVHMKEIDAAFKRWWYSDQASDVAKEISHKKQTEKEAKTKAKK